MKSARDVLPDLDELKLAELKVLLRDQHAELLVQDAQLLSQDERSLLPCAAGPSPIY